MNWCLISVFLYIATLTHFGADFLSHWRMEKKGILIILHSFFYTLFFFPVFWFLKVNYWWLILIFGSHLIIDSQKKYLLRLVKTILKKVAAEEQMEKIITFGLDQVLHLLFILIIALSAL